MKRLSGKKFFILIILVVVLVIVSFGLILKPGSFLGFNLELKNLLAQIKAVEINLLKDWQARGGLKRDLTFDSKGSEVTLLQKMLAQDEALYPDKKITGYYGELTTRGIKNFQQENGLAVTGRLDEVTKNRLNEIFLAHLCPESTFEPQNFLMRKITSSNPLPTDYVPPGLKDISNRVKTAGIVCVRAEIVEPLVQMLTAAKQDGIELMVTSGYRKPEVQQWLYDFWLHLEGEKAAKEIAVAGLSEHQLGSVVDLADASLKFGAVDPRFSDSLGGRWLNQNAHKYGFSLSFPENKQAQTGFAYEPWHWRYLGVPIATQLYEHNLSYNESNF